MSSYVQQTWEDGRAGGTPLSSARLSHMEAGIEASLRSDEAIPTGSTAGTALDARINTLVPSATTSTQGKVELATTGEATTGTDTTRAVTPAGLKAAVDALIAGAPGALDTLNEIATQMASDESAAGAITTLVNAIRNLTDSTFSANIDARSLPKAPATYAPRFLYNGSDETATLQAAITAVAAGFAGSVEINGRVSFATPLDLTGLGACAIHGPSSGKKIGSTQQAALIYTGTGSATAINAAGTKGLSFESLNITYTSGSFTGILLDLGGTTGGGAVDGSGHIIRDCLIRPTGAVNSHAKLVNLDRATNINFFGGMLYGDKAVYGKSVDASYSNIVNFWGTYISGVTADPIWNPGDGWNFWGVTVEATQTTQLPKFIGHDAGVMTYALKVSGGWFGDDAVAGAWIKVAGHGFIIDGGRWSMQTAGGSIIAFDGSVAAAGLVIQGNGFSINSGAFVVDMTGFSGVSAPIFIGANAYTNFPTNIVNGNIPNGSTVLAAGTTTPTYYSRGSSSSSWIWRADSSTRIVKSVGVTGEAFTRWDLRADGMTQGKDSAGTTTWQLTPNANGVLAAGNRSFVMDTAAASTLASNGAVAFDAKLFNVYYLTLNANMTSSTITNGTLWQVIEIQTIQDATGGRTSVFPTSFKGTSLVTDTTPNTRQISRWRYNGTSWHLDCPPVVVPN